MHGYIKGSAIPLWHECRDMCKEGIVEDMAGSLVCRTMGFGPGVGKMVVHFELKRLLGSLVISSKHETDRGVWCCLLRSAQTSWTCRQGFHQSIRVV